MAIMTTLDQASALRLKDRERAFRDDVASQLRAAGEGLGLNVTVETGAERVVLEFNHPEYGETGLRVIAGINEDGKGRTGWSDWLELRIETADLVMRLLTLGWTGGDDPVARLALYACITDQHLPLDARGLNAASDVREGKYARGDAVALLRGNLEATVRAADAIAGQSQAVVPFGTARGVPPAVEPRDAERQGMVLDVPFEAVPAASGRPGGAKGRTPSAAELKEMLIAEIFAAMQHELLSKEAGLKGSGALPAAKANFIEALEWAMLGVAYAVDGITSRTAIGTFIPGNASWIYGLVGPVVLGGLSSLAKSKIDKAAAFGLLAAWAVAVGLVTASDKNYLDGAQAWFPKGEEAVALRETVSIAHGDLAAAEKELARLEGKPGVSVTGTIAGARRRWQAEDLKKSAKLEKDEADAKLAAAQAKAKAERERVVREEGKLERAILKDPSRNEAWNALFAIFAVINFVGPYAIGRVIQKWRREHGAAKAEAQEGHYAREGAKILRETRAAHKAYAMQFFAPAVEKLLHKGVPVELLNGIDGAEIAGAAAERFDRSVNAQKFRLRLRLWGMDRS